MVNNLNNNRFNTLIFNWIKNILHSRGYDITHKENDNFINTEYPSDFSEQNIEIIKRVKKYTMTSIERLNALINSVNYIVENNITGSFVECGVWKGGSVMAMALSLINKGVFDKEIYLYDTFYGMPSPENIDVNVYETTAIHYLSKHEKSEDSHAWCITPKNKVEENIYSTGYPKGKFKLIEGKVEETIPGIMPKKISLLRLDTDWYASTKHEMENLFPLLVKNGVLIIDDYGHWAGCKKAIDEYIKEKNISILLNRIDNTGRIAIKP